MKSFARALLFFLLVVGASSRIQAQSAAPVPDLRLSYGGVVSVVAVMPDGGTLLGGTFSTVNGVPRSNLARLLPDGSLDLAWHADADGTVSSIAVSSGNEIFVGGYFFNVSGASRYNIAKLDALGNVDPTWNPGSSGTGIVALALDNTGYLYVSGGEFPNGGGHVTHSLAKLATDTGHADPDWDPTAAYNTFWVYTLLPDNNGSIYAGGYFTNIGGLQRYNLARLSTSGVGAADPVWNPVAYGGPVYALALDGGGSLFVGGAFDSAGGLQRFGLAKLSTSGSGAADENWDPVAGGFMRSYAMKLDGNGAIYVGGDFSFVSGVARQNIAKLSTSGTGASENVGSLAADGQVRSIAIGPTGVVMAGGYFLAFGGLGRAGFAALSPNGLVMPPGNVGTGSGNARAFLAQPDGSIIVGGNFQLANGVVRQNLVRIAPSGSMDLLWDPGLDSAWTPTLNPIYALAGNAYGDVYVGGAFTRLGGLTRLGLAKITSGLTGTVDAAWEPVTEDISYPVYAAALAVDGGSVFVGGFFDLIGGQLRTNLAKVDASGIGAADTLWNPAPDSGVSTLALDAKHGLYVGGNFANIGNVARSRIAKVSTIGAGIVDPSWDPAADGQVTTIRLDDAQAVYAAGIFSNIGGKPLPNIAKLTGNDGSADPNWITPTPSVLVEGIAPLDGKVYLGGRFDSIQGLASSHLARLDSVTGKVDPAWLPRLHDDEYEPNDEVFTIAAGVDNSVYAGGSFTRVDVTVRTGFAKFLPDTIFGNGFD